jgi:SAM-dependent methyltransferase
VSLCRGGLRLSRSTELEWLDAPGHAPAALAGNLADLRRVNRWLGGVRLTLRALERLTADLRPGATLAVVDVAAGGADIPEAVVDWATRRGVHARVVATDLSPRILALAARAGSARVPLAAADARALPLADRSVDVATCSLALHHLAPDDAVGMLREMRRVARRGIVVNDLVRGWLGYGGAWALSRALTNPLTRHDAPLSARRAYTLPEMRMLAARAGLGPLTCERFLGYRVAWTAVSAPWPG